MSTYLIVYRETHVSNVAAFQEYSRRNRASVTAWTDLFGLAPLVVFDQSEALEGATPDGVVVLRFPTMDDARAWYHSSEYQAVLPFRMEAADWRVVLVEGMGVSALAIFTLTSVCIIVEQAGRSRQLIRRVKRAAVNGCAVRMCFTHQCRRQRPRSASGQREVLSPASSRVVQVARHPSLQYP